MQKLCLKDLSGKGVHCFCVDVDARTGIKKCCKCNQWNIQGTNWSKNSDFR